MPRLKGQYEAFCASYVAFPNAGEAAEAAGYSRSGSEQQGHRLLRRADVSARIAELREEMAARECASVGALIGKLETAYADAVAANNVVAIVRVVELQARIAGYLPSTSRFEPARPTTAPAARRKARPEAHTTEAAPETALVLLPAPEAEREDEAPHLPLGNALSDIAAQAAAEASRRAALAALAKSRAQRRRHP